MRAAPAPALLRVEDLSVAFPARRGTLEAVRNVFFDVAPGETLAIVGESGSGKSVTALAILRLIEREGGRITSGRVLYRAPGEAQAVDLLGLDEPRMRAIRGRDISMIFQEPMTSLNPVLTVGEQIREVLVHHRRATPRDAGSAVLAALERCSWATRHAGRGNIRTSCRAACGSG